MLFTGLLDDWLSPDDRAVLQAWDDLVGSLVGDRIEPDACVDYPDMTGRLNAIRQGGWLEMALPSESSNLLYFEAVKRLHRRVAPLPVPLLEIWCALRLLVTLREPAESLLAAALRGEAVVVLAVDEMVSPPDADSRIHTGWVPFGDGVTVLLPVRRGGLVEVLEVKPTVGAREPVANPDITLPSVSIAIQDLDGLPVLGTLSESNWQLARAELLIAQAAALAGQAQALFESTMAYISVREQFGVPVGSFQALRHRSVDIAVEVYTAQQMTVHAATQVDSHPDPFMLGLMAKALSGTAAVAAASEAIQMQGGMGFTWEGGAHFGLKRCVFLATGGMSIADCEDALGSRMLAASDLLWAGGLDERLPVASTPGRER